MSNIEAVGGWIIDGGNIIPKTYRNLTDIHDEQLDTSRMEYFEDYRSRYFNDRFIPGQGAEEIFDALSMTSLNHQKWMDIGAGVTSLFWSIGLDNIQTVDVCDLVPEALKILDIIVNAGEIPPCYHDALSLQYKNIKFLSRMRKLPWQFHVFDALEVWPTELSTRTYDVISAIGCFGLSSGESTYSTAFDQAVKHLSPEGHFIGADWIRSDLLIAQEGHDNRYLGLSLSSECARRNGMTKVYEKQVNIVGDPYYDSITIWNYKREY